MRIQWNKTNGKEKIQPGHAKKYFFDIPLPKKDCGTSARLINKKYWQCQNRY